MERKLDICLNKTENTANILREFGKRDIAIIGSDYKSAVYIAIEWKENGYHWVFMNNIGGHGITIYKLDKETGETIDEFVIPLAEINAIYSL